MIIIIITIIIYIIMQSPSLEFFFFLVRSGVFQARVTMLPFTCVALYCHLSTSLPWLFPCFFFQFVMLLDNWGLNKFTSHIFPHSYIFLSHCIREWIVRLRSILHCRGWIPSAGISQGCVSWLQDVVILQMQCLVSGALGSLSTKSDKWLHFWIRKRFINQEVSSPKITPSK